MKKMILLLLCLLSVNIQADEWDSEELLYRETSQTFNYWTAGVGPLVLIPNVGVGRRQLNEHYGWDVSFNVELNVFCGISNSI